MDVLRRLWNMAMVLCLSLFLFAESETQVEPPATPALTQPAVRKLQLAVYADASFRQLHPQWTQTIAAWIRTADLRFRQALGVGLEVVCYHPWEVAGKGATSAYFLEHLIQHAAPHKQQATPTVHFVLGFTGEKSFLGLNQEHGSLGINGTLGVSAPRWRVHRLTKRTRPDTESLAHAVIYAGQRRSEGIVRTLQHELSHLLGVLEHEDQSYHLMNSIWRPHHPRSIHWLAEHRALMRAWAHDYLQKERSRKRSCGDRAS